MVICPIKGYTDSIIQILGILSVDGHHGHIPQIPASGTIRLGYLLGYPLHLAHDLLAEFHRQIKATYDRHDVYTGIVDMSQDLHDFTLRALRIRAVSGDLHHDLMSGHGPLRPLLRHENILCYLRVIRNDKAKITLGLLIGSHHLSHTPGNDADNLRFLAFAGLRRQKCHFHGILMECSTLLVLRNEQILVPSFHFHKSKAFGIADKSSCQNLTVGLHIFTLNGQGKLSFR